MRDTGLEAPGTRLHGLWLIKGRQVSLPVSLNQSGHFNQFDFNLIPHVVSPSPKSSPPPPPPLSLSLPLFLPSSSMILPLLNKQSGGKKGGGGQRDLKGFYFQKVSTSKKKKKSDLKILAKSPSSTGLKCSYSIGAVIQLPWVDFHTIPRHFFLCLIHTTPGGCPSPAVLFYFARTCFPPLPLRLPSPSPSPSPTLFLSLSLSPSPTLFLPFPSTHLGDWMQLKKIGEPLVILALTQRCKFNLENRQRSPKSFQKLSVFTSCTKNPLFKTE